MVKTGRSFGGVNDAFYLPVFFLNKIDKMAIFGLYILKIFHEITFWTKKYVFFEGLLNG